MKKVILSVFGMLIMAGRTASTRIDKGQLNSTTPTSLQNMAAKTT